MPSVAFAESFRAQRIVQSRSSIRSVQRKAFYRIDPKQMSTDILYAAIGGAGLYFVPWLCVRALTASSPSRGAALGYGVVATAALLPCLLLVFSNWLVALISFALVCALTLGRRALWSSRHRPDYVVEGPLLDDALSPELVTELGALENEARDSELSEERTIRRPLTDPSEVGLPGENPRIVDPATGR